MAYGPKTLAEAKKHTYRHSFSRNPKPDYQEGRCIASVHDGGRWPGFHQCNRKAIIDKCWCKQHSPAEEQRKEEAYRAERDREHKANARRNFIAYHGYEFYEAIVKIADGHNDARTLATQLLDKTKRIPDA